MRVLALTNLYPTPYHPTRAPFNRHQFRLLAERHPVRVIAPVLWTDELAARRQGKGRLPAGRRVELDGLTVDHPRYWYTPKLLRGQYGRFFRWSVQATFARAVREFRPDLVFAPWAYPDGWAAVKLAREAGLPAVVQVHGSDVRQLDEYPDRTDGTAAALRRADGVIAVSQDLADRIVGMGVDRERVRVVVDGVDQKVFRPGDQAAARQQLGLAEGVQHLLSVGNLVPVKGMDVLVAACGRLPADPARPWQLNVVGGGPEAARLAAQAGSAGIADKVRFHGIRPHGELPAWYHAADLFVLASRSEGVPNVILEAAACRVGIVATRVGGVPEVAHLGATTLVPPEDPAAMASAIAGALARPPAFPADGPRDRREAVADAAAFLEEVVGRTPAGTSHPTS